MAYGTQIEEKRERDRKTIKKWNELDTLEKRKRFLYENRKNNNNMILNVSFSFCRFVCVRFHHSKTKHILLMKMRPTHRRSLCKLWNFSLFMHDILTSICLYLTLALFFLSSPFVQYIFSWYILSHTHSTKKHFQEL